MKSPVSIYLISLSAFDILLLVCAFVLFFEYPFVEDDITSLQLSTYNLSNEEQFNILTRSEYNQNDDNKTISSINTGHRIYALIQAHLVYPIALTAQTAAIWITVSLTVERYIAGCYPLHANVLSSVPKSRLVVCCCIICAIVYNIPRWFEITTNQPVNTTELTKEPNFSQWPPQYEWHSLFRLVYYTWGYILVMFLLPLIALLVMNIRLMYALRRSDFAICNASHSIQYLDTPRGSTNALVNSNSNLYSKTSTSSRKSIIKQLPIRFQRSDHCKSCKSLKNPFTSYGPTRLAIQADKSITRMIIVVVGVFIACQLPALVFNIYFGIVSPKVLPHGWCALSELRNFLVVVNSSVNFIVYCVMGAKFRRSFVHVITPCWETKLTSNIINTHKGTVRLIALRSDATEL
ncbi:FMRFamide receptor [Schistosoma japonicum]|uniref:FMRFamide receptor n=1 Tax=Schistosoma japonicum TaxID=6182 RepID=A0A4Z2DEG9_SCHJA|nr:FMRFamide receptor [Schistosoma japonicum]